ncbi:hypothetical protein [Actinoplanes sp. M2I2]|uniref:hypothetical protein n=1 Tax=Actinoplanes sp. M2I2 TaxID=1734444 RepID=UPI00201FF721|nr:hypothetical protein [Actinoplanes sp. M2I2]
MTNTVAGLARTGAPDWWSVGTVLVANGALVTSILSGQLRQATGGGGGFVPVDFLLGPVGLGALTVGLAVALSIAWRQRATAGSPAAGIGRGIGATALGWALAFGLDVAAAMVVILLA